MTLEFYSGVIFAFSKGVIDKKCVYPPSSSTLPNLRYDSLHKTCPFENKPYITPYNTLFSELYKVL